MRFDDQERQNMDPHLTMQFLFQSYNIVGCKDFNRHSEDVTFFGLTFYMVVEQFGVKFGTQNDYSIMVIQLSSQWCFARAHSIEELDVS